MSGLTQQTFLGASIRYFHGSIGWGNSPTTLNVGLVVDPANGDRIPAPVIGAPVVFAYSGWTFEGVLQSWRQDFTSQGNPVYEIIIEDPRQVLSGVQLILSGYNGSTQGVPNLLNVFGYLEDPSVFGFGGAQVNDAGIPWQMVVKGVTDLTNGANPSYGGTIALAGYPYTIDLTALPQLPSFYRVPSATISLMDFIAFVCEAACCDFYFTLSVGTIQLGVIDRNKAPVFGAIDGFIASVQGASARDAGFEFRNETTSKFLVGGPVSEMYFQSPTPVGSGNPSYPEQEVVWPFWGLDYDQNAIIGSGNGIHHSFAIPTRNANVFNLGEYYATDVQELMAAFVDYSAWTNFLSLNNNNRWTNDSYEFFNDVVTALGSKATDQTLTDDEIKSVLTMGTNQVTVNGHTYYEHSRLIPNGKGGLQRQTDDKGNPITYLTRRKHRNPHFMKINKLAVSQMGSAPDAALGYMKADFPAWAAGLTQQKIQGLKAPQFAPFEPTNVSTLSQVRLPGVPDTITEQTQRLFQLVNSYAHSYMGTQFMVNIPFITSAIESETNAVNPTNVQLSRQPDTSAYIDENDWPTAIANNYLPGNIDRMIDSKFKVRALRSVQRYHRIRLLVC